MDKQHTVPPSAATPQMPQPMDNLNYTEADKTSGTPSSKIPVQMDSAVDAFIGVDNKTVAPPPQTRVQTDQGALALPAPPTGATATPQLDPPMGREDNLNTEADKTNETPRSKIPVQVDSAVPAGWADLPSELIEGVLKYITCGVDKLNLSWTHSHWGETIRKLNRPVLPLLFLPSSSDPMLFNPINRCLHSVSLPAALKEGIVYGAPGAWLFIRVNESKPKITLFNICTRRHGVDLPLTILGKDGNIYHASMKMLALSAPPSTPDYMAAAVLTKNHECNQTIATWKSGQNHWIEVDTLSAHLDGHQGVSDMIFYQGAFHFLTFRNDLIILVPEGSSFSLVRQHVQDSPSKHLDDYFEFEDAGNLQMRYLSVSTNGHLLFALRKTHCSKKTLDVRVRYLLVDKAGTATWDQYKSTAGEMIYLGVASSISRPTELPGTIHFLDDRFEAVRIEGEPEIDFLRAKHETVYFLRDDMGGVPATQCPECNGA